MYQKLFSLLLIGACLAGCAGRSAHPVMVNQLDDGQKTCQTLKSEINLIESNIQRLLPDSNKTGKNIALGVAGIVAWPAWLFMDLSNAEKEEINVYRARHDRLLTIAQNKQCKVRTSATS